MAKLSKPTVKVLRIDSFGAPEEEFDPDLSRTYVLVDAKTSEGPMRFRIGGRAAWLLREAMKDLTLATT